ncbi:MAG: hypothetical protein QFC55_07975, partial [Chloroflexota bacterium]|nr:hypothetical protein [Chloroflexota bacterium]
MWIYGVMTLGLGVALVLIVVTYAKRPGQRHIGRRGGLIALAVAVALGAIAFAAVMLISGKNEDALLAAGFVGFGYLGLNLTVLAIGLWFKPAESWAVGAALATPVVVAAIGFGYSIFRS